MSLAAHSLLSPSLLDATMQVSRESAQNLSVSCYTVLPLAFADNCQIQDLGSRLFANTRNIFITGGTYVVSLSYWLYIWLKTIIHILSSRMSKPPPILRKGVWRFLYLKNQTPAHCLLDKKMYLTSFGRFLFILVIVNQCWGTPASSGEQEGSERLRSVWNS